MGKDSTWRRKQINHSIQSDKEQSFHYYHEKLLTMPVTEQKAHMALAIRWLALL